MTCGGLGRGWAPLRFLWEGRGEPRDHVGCRAPPALADMNPDTQAPGQAGPWGWGYRLLTTPG